MLEWQEHIVQSPKCNNCCVLFAATARGARCKHIVCTHSTAAAAAAVQPSSTHLSGSEPQATSHSAAMSSAGTRTTTASSNVYFGCKTLLQVYVPTLFVLQLQGLASRRRSICWLGFNYTTDSGFAHVPRFFRPWEFKLCGLCILGNTKPQKTCRGS